MENAYNGPERNYESITADFNNAWKLFKSRNYTFDNEDETCVESAYKLRSAGAMAIKKILERDTSK